MSDTTERDEIDLYLKDHYAGGIGALELLEHSIKEHAGTPLGAFFADLRSDIKADHDQLHNLISALGLADSDLRNAGAWLAEKFSRAKLGFSGGEDSGLRLLQALEGLALGITGKRLLWRALHSIRESRPALEQTDFKRLEERAVVQFDRVEIKRLESACSVFRKGRNQETGAADGIANPSIKSLIS